MSAELTIEYTRKPWMREAARKLEDPKTRVLIVNAGVHTGKTNYFTAWTLDDMLRSTRELYWWGAAREWQLGPFWDMFEPHARSLGAQIRNNSNRWRARFANQSRLYMLTAESLGRIASYHPDKLLVDEAAKLKERAANLLLVRAMNCKKAIFMSSSQASPHWVKWCKWGREKKDGFDYIGCTTEEAGILPKDEIDRIRRSLPEDFARQELDAVLLVGAGNVFRNVAKVATGWPKLPGKDKHGAPFEYLVTYDPAKHSDFGFVSVWRGHRQVRAYRWSHTDYSVQVPLVAEIARTYHNAPVAMDAIGPGEAVYEMLREESAKDPQFEVLPMYLDSNAKKQEAVNRAALAFEQGYIELVGPEHGDEYAACIQEHQSFTRERSGSGLIYTYNAPDGEHDDSVTCTLLRCVLASQPTAQVFTSARPSQGGMRG